jgi:ATP10 protein
MLTKFFMSPHALFKAEKAKYAPNFVGQSISSTSKRFELATFAATRKAALIGIYSTQMAHRMCKPYLEAVESTFAANPAVGVVRFQFEDHWAKMALLKYYIKPKVFQKQYTPEQQVLPVERGIT